MKKGFFIFFAFIAFLFPQKGISQTTDSLGVSPNPFSHSTTIHFELAQSDTVSLHVYSSTGVLVATYFDTFFMAGGMYNLPLNGDSLADGFYLVQLQIGTTTTIVKKAIKTATAGIKEEKSNAFIVFPNPVNDVLNMPIDGNKTITIADESGKIVQSIETEQKSILLEDLPKGVYFVTIIRKDGSFNYTQKIIKQ